MKYIMCKPLGLSDAALGEGTSGKLKRMTAREIANVRLFKLRLSHILLTALFFLPSAFRPEPLDVPYCNTHTSIRLPSPCNYSMAIASTTVAPTSPYLYEFPNVPYNASDELVGVVLPVLPVVAKVL